jgi:hypothetical protein
MMNVLYVPDKPSDVRLEWQRGFGTEPTEYEKE